jgi:hypothetical protein
VRSTCASVTVERPSLSPQGRTLTAVAIGLGDDVGQFPRDPALKPKVVYVRPRDAVKWDPRRTSGHRPVRSNWVNLLVNLGLCKSPSLSPQGRTLTAVAIGLGDDVGQFPRDPALKPTQQPRKVTSEQRGVWCDRPARQSRSSAVLHICTPASSVPSRISSAGRSTTPVARWLLYGVVV